ncbi:MASE1 domain-containing protein [Litorilituus lipolyticus]|uniref:Sensor histidine kinase n=1 Tax=Litorilituus lipolyticus TaxID=2491017 RepID=A0A502KV73_9GAMM|nr:MASE1 domain-containing protein [Litorilituus lipolyticus]TPH13931.1 hypothetical protein EPA86_12505 [Litorilituus lipolyticus]
MQSLSTKYITNFSLISIAYGMLWYFTWFLPVNFAVVNNSASWFLPAGFRFAAFLMLPRRYWLAIILGEWTAIKLLNDLKDPMTLFAEFVSIAPPALIYLTAAHIHLKLYGKAAFNNVKQTISLLFFGFSAAILTATVLVTSMIYHGKYASSGTEMLISEMHLANIFAFALGDIVGMLLIVPSIILISDLIKKRTTIDICINFKMLIQFFSIAMIGILLLSNLHQIPLYYIQMIVVMLVITCSYKYGWQGAVVSVFTMCIVIVLAALLADTQSSMIENQVYLITIAVIALILGTSISQQNQLTHQLLEQNLTLETLNIGLNEEVKKNQQLAAKVISIQESERKKISTELHDDIGQNITAINTEVKIIERLSTNQMVEASISNIKQLTSTIYSTAHHLMSMLRPRVIDELGLEKALDSSQFHQLLNKAGINYHVDIHGEFESLDDVVKIAIYRIAQESATNAIKHSQAGNFYLDLSLENQLLTLRIKDDGIGFDTTDKDKLKGRFGLLGIEERVLSLQGQFELNSSDIGSEIIVKI